MVETAESKQACRAASTLLYPHLEFGVKPCGEYTREDFVEILSLFPSITNLQTQAAKRSNLTVMSKWT